jgi:hypothetical protein
MNVLSRVAVAASGLGVVALSGMGLHLGCSALNSRGGRGDTENALAQEVIRSKQLDDGLRVVRSHQRAKQEVVRDLIAQRRTLPDAIAQFLLLSREWFDNNKSVKPFPTQESEEERAYQEIVTLVPYVLRGQPEEAAVVLSRLEKEQDKLQAGRKCPWAGPADPKTEGNRCNQRKRCR